MNDIANIPYVVARFAKDGTLQNPQEIKIPAGTTDLFIASHGWNNTDADAEKLYHDLFTNFAAVAPDLLAQRKFAIVGVIWPSKKFTDVVDAAVAEQSGAAGFVGGSTQAADGTLRAKLDLLEKMFGPDSKTKIAKAKKLIDDLENDPAARDEFVQQLRDLLDPAAAHEEAPKFFPEKK